MWSPTFPRRRRRRASSPVAATYYYCYYYWLYILALLAAISVVVIWYAMNTDRYYIHPLLTQLIPAGHCSCKTSTVFECESCLSCSSSTSSSGLSVSSGGTVSVEEWEFEYPRDANNQGLNHEQCQSAFPGLFEDIDRAVRYWKSHGNGMSRGDLDAVTIQPGMARAAISNGHLYVVRARAKGEDHRRKILAVLSSIHRALVSDPSRTNMNMNVNIEFIFSIEDKLSDIIISTGSTSDPPIWLLARTPTEQSVWLIPDFGFWAWDNLFNTIGPYDEVVSRITEAEKSVIPWEAKKKQLVWRGKPSFAPKLRRALIEAARDQPWGDVMQVEWDAKGENRNFLSLEEHCAYMFIAHVEGRSYSASLKYRQACTSVLIAHKLQYIQHHHYLLLSSGPYQNFVQVERDFSDLAPKMEYLLSHPEEARRIAENSVRTFRERYLTLAAEVCYWRRLFGGYSSVWNGTSSSTGGEGTSTPSRQQQQQRGLRYESFVLLGSQSMMDFTAPGA